MMEEKTIGIEILAGFSGAAEEELKAYADVRKKNLTMEEGIKALIGVRLGSAVRMSPAEIKKVIKGLGLGPGDPDEVVRIADDGVVVVKLRLRKLMRALRETLERVADTGEIRGEPKEEEEKEED